MALAHPAHLAHSAAMAVRMGPAACESLRRGMNSTAMASVRTAVSKAFLPALAWEPAHGRRARDAGAHCHVPVSILPVLRPAEFTPMYVWLTVLASFGSVAGTRRTAGCARSSTRPASNRTRTATSMRWPDGWTRRRGEGFPQYLNIGIVDDPAGERCALPAHRTGWRRRDAVQPSDQDRSGIQLPAAGQVEDRAAQARRGVLQRDLSRSLAQQRPKESYHSPEFTLAPGVAGCADRTADARRPRMPASP